MQLFFFLANNTFLHQTFLKMMDKPHINGQSNLGTSKYQQLAEKQKELQHKPQNLQPLTKDQDPTKGDPTSKEASFGQDHPQF